MENNFQWTDEEVKEFITTKLVSKHGEWLDRYMREFKEGKKKYWEIVSFISKDLDNYLWTLDTNGLYRGGNDAVGEYSEAHLLNDEYCYSVKTNKIAIHSVRRLSDGEEFTVGDSVDSTWGIETITSFRIQDSGRMVVGFGTCANPLEKISKAPVKKPLFTTEDGVDIFDDKQTIYGVLQKNDWMELEVPCSSRNTYDLKYWKFFSSEEKRLEFLLLNKPVLSVNECVRQCRDIASRSDVKKNVSTIEEALKELAASKIKGEK